MRNIKNNLYRQNQQFKLATLLDFYQANPQQEYTVVIHNGTIKTILASPEQSCQHSYEPALNLNAIDAMAKKTIGVFSNIVQQMKEKRDNGYQPQTPSNHQPKKQYQFYYKCLNDGRQPRGTSTKKVKERATGVAEDNSFKFINLNTRAKDPQNQNTNYLNAQLYSNDSNKTPKQIQAVRSNKKRSCEAFVDLDFSFEEVSDQHEQSHRPSTDPKKDSKIEIRIIDMSQECPLRTPKNIQQGQNFPQTLIPTTVSKEILCNRNEEQLLPIPYKPRFEIKCGNLNKLNELCINTLSREDSKVEGAKKAQSRIYEQKPKESAEERDIQIDFDLDLNFI